MNKIHILKSIDQIKSNWKGGATTQLFIYPEHTQYANRDFDFRISTATIAIAESKFTPLPGFNRDLMVLDGELEISHKNYHSKLLRKFDVDKFRGDWETSSKGIAVDFNLIYNENQNGDIVHLNLSDSQELELDKSEFIGIYLYEGALKICSENETFLLSEKDFIAFEKLDNKLIISSFTKYSNIIFVRIITSLF